MKLFLETGFTLDKQTSTYRNDLLVLLSQSEASILKFLGERDIHLKGTNAALKQMRALHRAGELNGKIQRYRSLLWSGAIVLILLLASHKTFLKMCRANHSHA